jgi:hypothetical protein
MKNWLRSGVFPRYFEAYLMHSGAPQRRLLVPCTPPSTSYNLLEIERSFFAPA